MSVRLLTNPTVGLARQLEVNRHAHTIDQFAQQQQQRLFATFTSDIIDMSVKTVFLGQQDIAAVLIMDFEIVIVLAVWYFKIPAELHPPDSRVHRVDCFMSGSAGGAESA